MLQYGCGIIIKQNNKILILRRSEEVGKGQWCFPGGKVENNESNLEAIIRELKEETGIEISELKNEPIEIGKFKDNDFEDTTYFSEYIGELNDIKIQEDEVDKYDWLSVEEIEQLNLFDYSKKSLGSYKLYQLERK